ncbi:MAG TPA: sterol desaturase family protein [Cyclobacteriaceae bacterium]|nr:sterol desaturase family protein [Cyclobacteriaceae bacterium]
MDPTKIIFEWSYLEIFFATLGYFLFLYFVLAPLFQSTCRFLERKHFLTKIAEGEVSRDQVNFEIRHSVSSIIVFGFSSLPLIYVIRTQLVSLASDTLFNIFFGIVLLNIWNEIHFFVIHRIMHLPWFMKRVHAIHHRSVVPTVWSVYSFHWFEAFLLSTVPLTLIPFIALSPLAIALYPLTSVLLNYSGHSNYRFGSGDGPAWKLFSTRHAEHHYKRRQNYGFATNLLDWLYSYKTRKK